MNENSPRIAYGWTTALGVLMIAMGAVAITLPIAATLEMSWCMGAVFLISGVSQLIHAFRFDARRIRAWRTLMAVISIVAGVLTLRNPFSGAITITLVMALYLLTTAVARGLLVLEFGGSPGRGWLAFSSIISLFLGVYLLTNLATSSLVIPGTFLGVDLMTYGYTFIALASEQRKSKNHTDFEQTLKAA